MSSLNDTTIFGLFHKRAMPEGAMPVQDFDLNKYLGRWYEIARMDYFWEKKTITNVFPEYSLNEEGTVDVLNTGFNEKSQEWDVYKGEARFRTDNDVAALEVSFFAGIWAGYNVISVDDDYKYALVFGRNLDYLWFMSRDRSMPEHIKDKYLRLSKDAGYDTSKLNWTDQSKPII
jgi:apolipoprotein D and lipocalin family protein